VLRDPVDSLKEKVGEVMAIDRVGAVLKPVVDPMMARLTGWTQPPA
jgi:hypothetical protein